MKKPTKNKQKSGIKTSLHLYNQEIKRLAMILGGLKRGTTLEILKQMKRTQYSNSLFSEDLYVAKLGLVWIFQIKLCKYFQPTNE